MEQAEPSAAEALLEHRGFVRMLARSLVSDDAGEDLAQDALAAGLSQPPKCERAWRSWLRSTVQRLHWNRLRSGRRSDRREREAAQREALPSTAALVMRLELEQRVVAAVLTLPAPERAVVLLHFYDGQESAAIAASLGVPADTVRARLRRALARLRGQLDRSCGDREGWQRGLAALALGGAAVSSKLVLTSIAAVVVAAAAWFVVPETLGGSRGAASEIASRDAARRATGAASEGDAAVADPLAEPARVALPAGEEAASGEVVAELPPPGQVAFHVIDAETRAPIDDAEIRFLNDRRFAVFEGGSTARLALTSGRWSARVSASGHEPVEIAALDLAVGHVTELGTIELVRGGGRIEGRVTARGVADALRVELRGAGRSACARCRAIEAKAGSVPATETEAGAENGTESIGADCGFGQELSQLQLLAGETFRFTDLAAGTYWLRAFDATTQLVDSRRVEVARNGAEWVELDVSLPTSLVVELRQPSGRHFTGVWAMAHREEPARIEFRVQVGEKARGAAHFVPTPDDVRSTMGPPISIGDTEAVDGATSSESIVRLQQLEAYERALLAEADVMHAEIALQALDRAAMWEFEGERNDRIDREREPADGLVPLAQAPDLDVITLAAERLRPDCFEIGPLPRAMITLTVASHAWASEPLLVDLRFGFTGPLLVTLSPMLPDEAATYAAHPDIGVSASQSCLSCHGGAATAPRGDAATFNEVELLRSRLDALSAEAALRERR